MSSYWRPEISKISPSSSYTIPIAIPNEKWMFVGCPRGWSTPGYRPRPAPRRYLSTRDHRKKNPPPKSRGMVLVVMVGMVVMEEKVVMVVLVVMVVMVVMVVVNGGNGGNGGM